MTENIIQSNKSLLQDCEDMYGKYGRYINKWRAFPLYEDGLKLVERRVLYSEYLTARKKLTKSAEVVGYCMGKLHPHGDCISGDTIIPLLDGTRPTIKELCDTRKNDKFYVYSCDPDTGKIVPGLAHSPRIGQITDGMYVITLDNGEVVKCTKNHPFMTRWNRDERYVKAENLKVGMSLRPIQFKKCKIFDFGKEYEFVRSTYSPYKETHKIVGEYFYGNTEGYAFHHKDFNTLNNSPDNIQKLSRSEHVKIHYTTDSNYKEKAINGLVKGHYEMFDENGKYRQLIKQKNSELIKKYNETHIYAVDRAVIYIQWLAKNVKDVNEENYKKYRKEGGYNVPKLETLYKHNYISSFDELVKKSEINHKIVKIDVVKLDKPVEFYDITVDKYENFAIGQGIFVHNSSIYGSLVQLCNCGLSDFNGNFGTNIGLHDEPPAAMRYTEVKMNEDVVKMAFQHMDFIPMESLELPMKEPVYLASKLPFCLIRGMKYCEGIGFGFKAYIPSFTKEDLVKRLHWLITKQGKEPIIKPVTDCVLKNTDDVYKQLLTTGKAKVMYCGKAKLDKVNKCIIINSKSPSKKWSVILNKFKDEIQVQKSIGYIDESCGSKTEVRFQILKRGQNLDKIYKTICDCISGEVSFMCNMCDTEGNVKIISVDQMLLRTYQVYKEANRKLLEFNIQKCQQIIDELILVERVKKVLPKWLKTHPDDISKLIDGVEQDTKISKDILVQMFEKYTIPRFTRCKTDTTDKQNLKSQLMQNLQNIDDFTWRLYEQL